MSNILRSSWLSVLLLSVSLVSSSFAQATPAFVQGAQSASYAAAQSAGNLNVVVVFGVFTANGGSVTAIADSRGNAYTFVTVQLVGLHKSYSVFYAKNIVSAAAGANTVSVTASSGGLTAATVFMTTEYSGVDAVNPFDGQNSANSMAGLDNGAYTTGSLTTTNANDLLVGAFWANTNMASGSSRIGGGTVRELKDRVVTAVGSYAITADPLSTGLATATIVAFKSAGDTQAPTVPTGLSATAASSSQINLSWTAATDNVGVTGYFVERCQGSGCSAFTQIATPTAATFTDTGLSASTSYSYRVRARDAVPNIGPYSSTATAVTAAPPAAQPGSATFQYDSAGRLGSVLRSSGTYTNYTLDAAGNRTQVASSQPIQVNVASAQATEGSSVPFTVIRTGASGAFTVTCRLTSGSATAGSDFNGTDIVLSFAASDTSKPCPVPTTNDGISEGTETFTLKLVNLSANVLDTSGPGPIVGTILDAQPLSTFTLSAPPSAVSESSGTISFTVTMSPASGSTQSVKASTFDGSAKNAWDYLAKTDEVLTFDPGVTSRTFQVTLVDDSGYEDPENFTVTLSAPSPGATIGTASAVGSITDDDAPVTDMVNITQGATAYLRGWVPYVIGSVSPATTAGGKSYDLFADFIPPAVAQGMFAIGGFTSDPGRDWLYSATVNGITRTGATAGYSYNNGQATWVWPGQSQQFNFSGSGTVTGTIVHQ